MRTPEQMNALFKQAISDMETAGIHVPIERLVSLVFNAPMGRSWGKCHYTKIGPGEWNCRITLSKALCQYGSDTAFKRTSVHELIHLCTPGEGHGASFKRMAMQMRMMFPDKYDITRRTGSEKVFENAEDAMSAYKYVVKCPKCNQRWGYGRMSKVARFPWLYHCRKCGCKLEREK